MAPMLIIAGAGLMAAGELQEGEAAEAEGKSAQNMANYNAQVQKREAEAARQKSRFDQRRQTEQGSRIESSQTTSLAKANTLGSPVAEDLSAEQASEFELENLLIVLEGFQDKGIKIPKDILNDLLYEPRKVTQTDDNFSKDKPS